MLLLLHPLKEVDSLHSFSIPWFSRVGFYMAMVFWWGSFRLVLDVSWWGRFLFLSAKGRIWCGRGSILLPRRGKVDEKEDVSLTKEDVWMKKIKCLLSPKGISWWGRWSMFFPYKGLPHYSSVAERSDWLVTVRFTAFLVLCITLSPLWPVQGHRF